MNEIARIVAYDKDDNVLFDSVNGEGAAAAPKPKVLVEYRVSRTKEGNFTTYGDGTKMVSNGTEVLRSKAKANNFLVRVRLSALVGPCSIKRVSVDKQHGLRIDGIKAGLKLLPGDKPLVFDVFYGPLDKAAYKDAWFTVDTKEHGVIVKDGIRVVEA